MEPKKTAAVSDWVYNSNYSYWTMSIYNDSYSAVNYILFNGDISANPVSSYYTVRPVVELFKNSLEKTDETTEIIDIDNIEENNIKVKVPNTFEKVSIIFIMIGVVLVSISIVIVLKNKKR